MKQRPSLARRLLRAQVLVAATGVLTLIVVSALVTPRIFADHLYTAGETDPAVQAHAQQALASSFLLGGVLAVLLSLSAAWAVSVVQARRVSRPLEQLVDVTGRIEQGGLDGQAPAHMTAEMAELHEALHDMGDRLEHASKVRTQLMADLSHELRTPLATLEAQVDALEDGFLAADEETYAAMREQLVRLRRLAIDVRLAAAAQEHALDLVLQSVDARDVVTTAYTTALPRFGSKGTDLLLDIGDEPLPVACDTVRMGQVLANLLDNALRHTPAGGTVRLTADRSAGKALVAVEDDGEGIPAGHLQRIFERFHRVDASRASFDGSGSGLGLTIAQAIVADHGGEITAYSDGPGKGARFTLTLPLRQ